MRCNHRNNTLMKVEYNKDKTIRKYYCKCNVCGNEWIDIGKGKLDRKLRLSDEEIWKRFGRND